MRQAGTVTLPVGYRPGDHLCWLYDADAEWLEATVGYLAEGVRRHEQLLHVADRPEGSLIDDLEALPVRDALLEPGQLRVRSREALEVGS